MGDGRALRWGNRSVGLQTDLTTGLAFHPAGTGNNGLCSNYSVTTTPQWLFNHTPRRAPILVTLRDACVTRFACCHLSPVVSTQ